MTQGYYLIFKDINREEMFCCVKFTCLCVSLKKRGQISEDVLSGSVHSAKARVIFCLEWPVVHMPVYREN